MTGATKGVVWSSRGHLQHIKGKSNYLYLNIVIVYGEINRERDEDKRGRSQWAPPS